LASTDFTSMKLVMLFHLCLCFEFFLTQEFWNFYDILYNNQGSVNSGWASKDNLKKFALQISGLDTQKFNSCLDSGKYVSLVQNDLAFATSLGLQGTPAFIIEKSDGSKPELLPGAYPFPDFHALINKRLTVDDP